HADLVNYSPYVSHQVLKALIENETGFPQELLKDVLVRNPHALRSSEVAEALNNRSNPLSENLLDEIYAAAEQVSAKEELESEIARYFSEYNTALRSLREFYAQDSTDHDSIEYILSQSPYVEYHYGLVGFLIQQGKTADAQSYLNSIR